MTDLTDLFRRQAEWQDSLRHLPWPEKLRMAASVRDSVMKLSKMGSPTATSITPQSLVNPMPGSSQARRK